MKIVMDSDCLIKLTKADAKEAVVSTMETHIPYLVKRETVDEVKSHGYQDAVLIEKNIVNEALHVTRHQSKDTLLYASKGEKEVVLLYMDGGYDAIASDDQRFLKKLGAENIPFLTPAACLIYIYERGKITKTETLKLIENLKPFISSEEYLIARFYMEGKS